MGNKQNNNNGNLFTFLALFLTVLFVILKITNVITWSWWIVFLPLLIEGSIALLTLLILGMVLVILILVLKINGWEEFTEEFKKKLKEKILEEEDIFK